MSQRFMSTKRLIEVFGCDWDTATHIRHIVKNTLVLTRDFSGPYCDTFESVQKWVRQCYNEPSLEERQMCALNEVLDGYGVEGLRAGEDERYRGNDMWVDDHFWQGVRLEYVNMGDTYTPTIGYDIAKDRFVVTSWGDWYEANMKYTGPE